MLYYLYSPRAVGWLTKSSTYRSDLSEAKVFDRDEALAYCRRHKTAAGHNLIPVRQEDLQAL